MSQPISGGNAVEPIERITGTVRIVAGEPTYEGLVQYVRRNYVDYKRELWEDPARSWAYHYRILPASGQARMLDDLISQSQTSKPKWDALNLLAREALRNGESLPKGLGSWVADVLDRKRPRPKRGAERTSLRDRMMYLAVDDLRRRFGVTPTRNAASEGWSGCHVVAEASGYSYKTVEAAWAKRDPILS